MIDAKMKFPVSKQIWPRRPTVARLESVEGELGGRELTTGKIRAAIEAPGIEFIDENGGGPGVRLKKPPKKRP